MFDNLIYFTNLLPHDLGGQAQAGGDREAESRQKMTQPDGALGEISILQRAILTRLKRSENVGFQFVTINLTSCSETS